MLERPRPAPFPLQVRAAERLAEHAAGFLGEQVPGADQVERRVGGTEAADVEHAGQAPAGDQDVPRGQVAVAHDVRRLARQFPERGPHVGQARDVEESLALAEAGAHPRVVVLQVAAAPAAAERPAAGTDRPDPGDELRQVTGEGNRVRGVVLVARAAGQP